MQKETNLFGSKMENGMRIFKSKRLISLTKNKQQNKTASKCRLSLPLNQSVKFTYSQAPVRQLLNLLRRYAAFLHTALLGRHWKGNFSIMMIAKEKTKLPNKTPLSYIPHF